MKMIFRLFGISIVIYTIIFFAFAVVPLDPARNIIGPYASEQAIMQKRQELGLDKPIAVRYLINLKNLVRGDFGRSFYFQQPALEIVVRLMPLTLARAAGGLAFGVFFGFVAPVVMRRLRMPFSRNVFVLLQSTPAFCLAVVLMWIASRMLGLTPMDSGGVYELFCIICAAAYPGGAVGMFVWDRVYETRGRPRHVEFLHMLHAPWRRIERIQIREAAVGCSAIAINAVSVSITAVTFGEIIFDLSGFGKVFIESCQRADASIVIAGSIILTLLLVLLQNCGDLISTRIDPRTSGDV